MALSHTWKFQVSIPGLPALPADPNILVTGDVDMPVEVTVPAGQVVHIDNLNIKQALMQSVVMNATGDLTVFTNSSNGAGGQTFDLVKGSSEAWNIQQNQTLHPKVVTIDITDLYLDNSSGTADVTFRGAFLVNY